MRGALIRRWIEKVEEIEDIEEFVARLDYLEKSANVTLGHNLVPRVPQMLLIFLESSGGTTPSKLENGALANYYQYLITEFLLTAGVARDELSVPLSFAQIVAHAMFGSGRKFITTEELEVCNDEFNENFVPGGLSARLGILRKANILVPYDASSFEWRESYFYYLFLGNYFARNIESIEVKTAIRDMAQHLYVRSNANTLLFLTHYDRGAIVFGEITEALNSLFTGEQPLDIAVDTKRFASMVRGAGTLLIRSDPLVARQERDRQRDTDGQIDEHDGMSDAKREEGAITMLDEVIVLFKSSEIIGQVLKEQYATVTRNLREPILSALLSAYLRAVGALIRRIANDKRLLQSWLDSRSGDGKTPAERLTEAQQLIASLVQMFVFGFYQKLADSVASDKTLDLVKRLRNASELEAKTLLLACELNVQRPIPFALIDELLRAVDDDPIYKSLVKNLVQVRVALFNTKAVEIQRLANIFEISVKGLNAISFVEGQRR